MMWSQALLNPRPPTVPKFLFGKNVDITLFLGGGGGGGGGGERDTYFD